jgi:hypothetical protein
MTALICNQSNGLYQQFMTYVNATSTNPVFMQVYETGLSGSQTRKARVAVTGGTMQVNGDITYPNQILVQDIGPA